MKLDLAITSQDIQNLRSFVSAHRNNTFVVQRIKRNVADGEIAKPSREEMWLTMMMCQLTSQQRSSPSSPVTRFLLETPFRLSLDACSRSNAVETFIRDELTRFGGIRFAPKISRQMSQNLERLKDGAWDELSRYLDLLMEQGRKLPEEDQYLIEREAAEYVMKTFSGFGPKQSRNFWQALGLTRYEFVLDSRVLKWLRGMDFPFPLSSMALGEEDYYCFISDILRDWCNQANVLPCVLDACIFSSFDAENWPEDAAVW